MKPRDLKRGTVCELRVAARLAELGCSVFTPITSSEQIDLIVIPPHGRPQRIQVKSVCEISHQVSTRHKQYTEWRLRVRRNHRQPGRKESYRDLSYTQIDYFVGVKGMDFWVIPYGVVATAWNIDLRACQQFRNAWNLILGVSLPEQRSENDNAQLRLVEA